MVIKHVFSLREMNHSNKYSSNKKWMNKIIEHLLIFTIFFFQEIYLSGTFSLKFLYEFLNISSEWHFNNKFTNKHFLNKKYNSSYTKHNRMIIPGKWIFINIWNKKFYLKQILSKQKFLHYSNKLIILSWKKVFFFYNNSKFLTELWSFQTNDS